MQIAEFELKDGEGSYRFRAKCRFLYNLNKIRPEIKLRLKNESYGLFMDLDFSNKTTSHLWNQWCYENLDLTSKEAGNTSKENFQMLNIVESIYKITNDYNISCNWIVESFAGIFDDWKRNIADNGLNSLIRRYKEDQKLKKPFDFRFKNWELGAYESKKEYILTVKKAFNNYLKTYLEDLEIIAEDQGLKRNKHPRQLDKHLIWFIRWQTDSTKSYADIANLYESSNSIEESAIRKAIGKMSELLEIPLRPTNKGRSKKRN